MRTPVAMVQSDSSVNRISVSQSSGLVAIPFDNRNVRIYDLSGNRIARLPRYNINYRCMFLLLCVDGMPLWKESHLRSQEIYLADEVIWLQAYRFVTLQKERLSHSHYSH